MYKWSHYACGWQGAIDAFTTLSCLRGSINCPSAIHRSIHWCISLLVGVNRHASGGLKGIFFKVMVKPYIVLADWCNYYTFELCLGAGVIVHAWLMHPWTSARKLPCLDESVCSVTALWISCQVGAQEACALSVCFLLWNITSLVTGKPEFFPLWGVLTKMTWQFVFQGWNQNTVINSAWANTTATLFSSSTLPDKGGGFLHTPRAWYFRAETSLCRPWGLSSSPLTGRSTF